MFERPNASTLNVLRKERVARQHVGPLTTTDTTGPRANEFAWMSLTQGGPLPGRALGVMSFSVKSKCRASSLTQWSIEKTPLPRCTKEPAQHRTQPGLRWHVIPVIRVISAHRARPFSTRRDLQAFSGDASIAVGNSWHCRHSSKPVVFKDKTVSKTGDATCRPPDILPSLCSSNVPHPQEKTSTAWHAPLLPPPKKHARDGTRLKPRHPARRATWREPGGNRVAKERAERSCRWRVF